MSSESQTLFEHRYDECGAIFKESHGESFDAFDRWEGVVVRVHVFSGDAIVQADELESSVGVIQRLSDVFAPDVVPILDFGLRGDREFYLTLPALESESLEEVLEQRLLSEEECVTLMRETLETLRRCQDAGLVHGDVGPYSIRFGKREHPKLGASCLVGFGFSMIVEKVQGDGDPVVVGSSDLVPLSCANDVYRLGLTCKRALGLQDEAETGAHVSSEPGGKTAEGVASISISPLLSRILRTMTDPTRSRRYRSAYQVLADLRGVWETERVAPVQEDIPHRSDEYVVVTPAPARKDFRRRRRKALMFMVLTVVSLSYWFLIESKKKAIEAFVDQGNLYSEDVEY
jgi:serine/threonine protein kinase